ncbi:MAG: hypothetical protein JO019_04440, partial [Candidatus Kaiserbacteria bacterium]|nr:hypothetical protein [Candidatus Kaiserbacteria bacterium]
MRYLAALALVVGVLTPSIGYADAVSDLQDQIAMLTREVAQLQKQIALLTAATAAAQKTQTAAQASDPLTAAYESLLKGIPLERFFPTSGTATNPFVPATSTPVQSTSTPATHLPQTSLIDGYDIYSPEPVMQGGQLRLYFGGWKSVADLPHDAIFVADCASEAGPCGNVRKAIDPTRFGLEQINDPSIVVHAAAPGSMPYYIMYMTGVARGQNGINVSMNGIYYSTSYANDGVNWSRPSLLLAGYWLPSATMRNGHVELYANSTTDGTIKKFDLGESGISPSAPSAVSFDNSPQIAPYYVNVNVMWRPDIGKYEMLAERMLAAAANA